MKHRSRLISYFFLLAFLLSCTPTPPPSPQTFFYMYRFDPPAFLEFSSNFQARREIPFSVLPNCGLLNIFPAPVGKFMAIELNCPNGQTVLFLDTSPEAGSDSNAITQPITDSDSHFLAWRFDGSAAFLRVDALGNPHVLRVAPDGKREPITSSEFTYDLASSLNQGEYTFTFSRGLGQGSELWIARANGKNVEQLYADPNNYISFVRFSPDDTHIAFLKTPDTQTPFTVGELWVMNEDGSNAHQLVDADAGHGYAANWSPDGKRIAFVRRENPSDAHADQSSEALISNIYMVDVASGALTQVTDLTDGRVETPLWSPEGNTLAFNVVINDRMEVRIAEITTGKIQSLIPESTCCPAWLRK